MELYRNRGLLSGMFGKRYLAVTEEEILPLLDDDRCSFFVPDNIEELIRSYGNQDLYDRQAQHTQNLDTTNHPEIQDLARIIHQYGKGLEQEILLQQSL